MDLVSSQVTNFQLPEEEPRPDRRRYDTPVPGGDDPDNKDIEIGNLT